MGWDTILADTSPAPLGMLSTMLNVPGPPPPTPSRSAAADAQPLFLALVYVAAFWNHRPGELVCEGNLFSGFIYLIAPLN